MIQQPFSHIVRKNNLYILYTHSNAYTCGEVVHSTVSCFNFSISGRLVHRPDCLGYPYPYLTRLLSLDACVPSTPWVLPSELGVIATPLIAPAWTRMLKGHPDTVFANYILSGIESGFRIGFKHSNRTLKPARKNMKSTDEHPEVVDAYLQIEVSRNRVVHLPPASLPWFQPSAFGVIHKPGKWRLIVDLSSPEGHSVNDSIAREHCSIAYISTDDIANTVLQLGRGSLLAKADVKEAFRTVPVAPQDRLLLAMQWKGELFVDKVLPFGLRSVPIIFTAVADALEWIVRHQGVPHIFHYVDDFIIVGKPESLDCGMHLSTLLQTCESLGVPIAPEKCEGPLSVLTVLGIEIDTDLMQLRLPTDKLARLFQSLSEWRHRKSCTKRELLSLLGTLHHAARVIRPGRAFVRRIIDLSTTRHHMEARIRLNRELRSDVEWWFQLSSSWNGVSILAPIRANAPDGFVTSDASGGWGCGAFCGSEWFQLRWDSHVAPLHITIKELLPIVVAVAIWGNRWSGLTIQANCDNMAVVHIIRSHHSKDPTAMHLLRCLALLECSFQFTLVSKHVPGKLNDIADALSRNNHHYFLLNYQQANQLPTPIPPRLYSALVHQQPDWTCKAWATQFTNITSRV